MHTIYFTASSKSEGLPSDRAFLTMRLIDTGTGEFAEFLNLSTTPPYAILSHTWNPPPVGEQTYQDIVRIQEKCRPSVRNQCPLHFSTPDLIVFRFQSSSDTVALSDVVLDTPHSERAMQVQAAYPFPTHRSVWDPDSGLSEKIRRACEVARRDGYRYIWIDSSCIDKTSSSELSEAINSMFNWYRHAQICYAFLSDIPSDENVRAEDSKFRTSRWFKRSWTLQELIAPRLVVFLAQDWEGLGTKDAFADLIQEITYIDRGILVHTRALADESVAERMRWASRREATRVEDEAYSLLGIFGVTMYTLYGEGAQAFQRLQEEILQRIPDQSLFAWGSICLPIPEGPASLGVPEEPESGSFFASSPRSFALPQGKTITSTTGIFWQLLEKLPAVQEYTPTPHGLRTQICLLPLQSLNLGFYHPGRYHQRRNRQSQGPWYLAILACEIVDDQQRVQVSKVVHCPGDGPFSRPTVLGVPHRIEARAPTFEAGHVIPEITGPIIFTLSWSDIERVHTALQTKTVYLLRPQPSTAERQPLLEEQPTSVTPSMSLSSWTRGALRPHGYAVSDVCPDHDPHSFSLTLSNVSFSIHIQYQHYRILTAVWSSGPEVDVVLAVARIWILSLDADEDVQTDTVERTSPYTSTAWAIRSCSPWSMPLLPRRVHLVGHSGDEIALQLGLGIAAPSRYHVDIEVAPPISAARTVLGSPSVQTRDVFYDDLLNGVKTQEPHADLKLTMLGSVRRTLEEQGYSVHLEGPRNPDPTVGSFYSLSLVSNVDEGFTISVKWFYRLRTSNVNDDRQELLVVARISLESIPSNGPDHDGPYVMAWEESSPWSWWLGKRKVGLVTPTGDSLTLELGLDLAWRSSEYYLFVSIERHPDGDPSFRPGLRIDNSPRFFLRDPHSSVRLTFPGHVRRALQAQGYTVHFDGRNERCPDHYHLTPSDPNLTIDVECSRHLSTASDETQRLTFRACVKVRSSPGSQDGTRPATQDNGQLVEWNA